MRSQIATHAVLDSLCESYRGFVSWVTSTGKVLAKRGAYTFFHKYS